MMYSVRTACVFLLLCVSLVGAPLGPRPAAAAPVASFQHVTCLTFGVVASVCGYVLVPEDRSKPHGRMVHLAVAVFRGSDRAAKPDPLLLLNGGPGQATIESWGVNLISASPPMEGRDLILVDQRGTGLSQPSLACTELAAAARQGLNPQLNQAQLSALDLQAVRRCHDRLTREGIDLSAYTTITDAADIAAIAPALGYRTVNLYGVSYGTLLALTVMRLYPTDIRSVMLDSVLPPDSNTISGDPTLEAIHLMVGPTNAAPALAALMHACAADRSCHTSYPTLSAEFTAVVSRLNATPAAIQFADPTTGTTDKTVLTGDDFGGIILNMLYETGSIPMVPSTIDAAAHGSYDALSSRYANMMAGTEETDTNAAGLDRSNECSEDAPFTTRAQLTASVQPLPAVLRAGQLAAGLLSLDECRIWHVAAVPAWQKTPVHSNIPTLVLTGQYDPITPSALGKHVAGTLTRSFFYTFPGQGHGQVFQDGETCGLVIATEFLAQPTHAPNAACIHSMPPLAFY